MIHMLIQGFLLFDLFGTPYEIILSMAGAEKKERDNKENTVSIGEIK